MFDAKVLIKRLPSISVPEITVIRHLKPILNCSERGKPEQSYEKTLVPLTLCAYPIMYLDSVSNYVYRYFDSVTNCANFARLQVCAVVNNQLEVHYGIYEKGPVGYNKKKTNKQTKQT